MLRPLHFVSLNSRPCLTINLPYYSKLSGTAYSRLKKDETMTKVAVILRAPKGN